ncbi:hypothetical protein LCM17_23005 [Cereibacter sphaeroides]|nr:hypothetical protein [Cereibacter sphaeroides]
MTKIYAWPKALRYTAALTDEELPVRSSRGMFSGRGYVSSAGPRRRVVQVTASALAGDRDGAGICASLNRLLGGRMNLVRMELPPVNWFRDPGKTPFDLEGPAMAGTVTSVGDFDAIALTGLVPDEIVCRAYDVLGSYVSGALAGTARAVRTVRAELDGTATIPLHEALPAGVIRVGEPETGVFRVTSMGRSPQTIGADFPTSWTLREVLASEIPAGATEVDPWA